jgi:hypothetical protein
MSPDFPIPPDQLKIEENIKLMQSQWLKQSSTKHNIGQASDKIIQPTQNYILTTTKLA